MQRKKQTPHEGPYLLLGLALVGTAMATYLAYSSEPEEMNARNTITTTVDRMYNYRATLEDLEL